MTKIVKLTLLMVFVKTLFGFSQTSKVNKPIEYSFKNGIFLSNGKVPFWQKANQFGSIPTHSPYFSTGGELKIDYQKDTLNYKHLFIDWGAKVDGVLNVSNVANFVSPEIYFKTKIGSFEVWGGRRKEIIGLVSDSTLTTGSYSWSGNALPIPKIQMNTLGFIEVPFTNKWLAFNATFSHGWFGDLQIPANYQLSQVNTYLHQKSLFVRLGKPNSKVRLYGGFTDNAQWGNEDKIWNGGLGGFKAYKAVVLGESWASSRVGNHLGSIDFGFDIKGKKWDVIFMRQNSFEAGALYWLRTIPDGLNSLSFVRKHKSMSNNLVLNKFLIEFLHTTNQGGDVWDWNLGIFGQESYFNHYLYLQGWSYKNKIIGTPFITRYDEAKGTWPENTNSNNNRVYVWHIAALGTYGKWDWKAKMSLSQNWGTYTEPLEGKPLQFSGILETTKKIKFLKGSMLTTAISFDLGKLYDNSFGIYFGIRKNGVL